jgi:hypothetical protein
MTDGIVRRLPVKGKDGSIDLIEIEGIFYLEAKENMVGTPMILCVSNRIQL